MTISNQTNKNQFTANGINLAFGYGFKINASNEVTVVVTDTMGIDTTQIEITDYTVSGVGNDMGGNINFLVAPANLFTVTITRNVPLTQTTDYIDNDAFSATSHEDGLDKTTMIAQRQQEELDRSIKVRTSSDVTFNPDIDLTSGGLKFLRINSSGNAIELAEGTGAAVSGLASVDGVSNAGGNVDFKSTDGTVTITPNDTNNDIDFSASASQPFSTLSGVSNSGGDVALVAGAAITVTPNDTNNTITTAFNGAGVPSNAISGNAIDGGIVSNFASTGIDDNTTGTKITITDSNTEINNGLKINSILPIFDLKDNDGLLDEKVFRISGDSGVLSFEALTDAFASGSIPIRILRTGTVIDEAEINATLIDINGNVDMSGTVDCTGTESLKVPVGTTAERPASPTNGDMRYNTTTNKLESFINGIFEDIATGTGVGETNLTANVGAGTGNVFRDKTGVTFNMKTLIGGTNITVTDNANDITIAAAASVGEANTASNVGGKAGTIFVQKTGVDLELKTISAGSGLTLTNNASDIDISLASTSIFDVTNSGATGDGLTDDTAAINTAITALLAGTKGGILYFPGGEYKISSKLTITLGSNDENIIIQGDGEELTQLSFTGAIDGIEIVLPSSGQFDSDKSAAIVRDLSIETDTAGGQTGLKFSGSSTGSVSPIKRTERVVFSGNSPTNFWGTSLLFDEGVFTRVVDCTFNGPGGAVGGGTGLAYTGTGIAPVDHHIDNCFWIANNIGISVTQDVEGVYVNQVTMVSVNIGIDWNTTAGEPLLTLVGSHINARTRCLDLNNCIQFLIQGNLLYADNGRTGAWIGIELTGTYGTGGSVGGNISDNVFEVLAGVTPTNGIVVDGVGGHLISNNKINNPDSGVFLKVGADNNIVLDNVVTNFAAAAVTDNGTNNTIRLIGAETAFRGALVFLTSTQSVSNAVTQTVSWQAEDYDTSGIFTPGSPTRLTVPAGVTRVRINSQVSFDQNGSSFRRLDIRKNGGDYVGRTRAAVDNAGSLIRSSVIVSTPVLTVVGGDFFQAQVRQESGASLNLSGTNLNWFSLEVIE